MEKEYYDKTELAEMLNVSVKAIEKWGAQRRIPGRTKIGHLVRYRAVDVQKHLAAGSLLISKG